MDSSNESVVVIGAKTEKRDICPSYVPHMSLSGMGGARANVGISPDCLSRKDSIRAIRI